MSSGLREANSNIFLHRRSEERLVRLVISGKGVEADERARAEEVSMSTD